MDRLELLDAAGEIINGERARDYGDAAQNFSNIAVGWNIIAVKAFEGPGRLGPEHVALMMDWLKTCRLVHQSDHLDSWIDKLGYGALGGEVVQSREL